MNVLRAAAVAICCGAAVGCAGIPPKPPEPRPEPPDVSAPPRPHDGFQVLRVFEAAQACPGQVASKVQAWAARRGLSYRPLVILPKALDVTAVPANNDTLLVATTSEAVARFASVCMLFDKYRDDVDKLGRLRTYLAEIQLTASRVTYDRMTALGFSGEDADHLTEHLRRFIPEDVRPDVVLPYRGILYFRVTYAFHAPPMYAITVETAPSYSLSDEQMNVVNDLDATVAQAAACPR